MELLNTVRALQYLAGVLAHQRQDPFCGACSAWNNSLNNSREAAAQFEREHAAAQRTLSPEASALLASARSILEGLPPAANPVGQKKAGNCKLPEGVCFVKASRAILDKI